MDNTLKLAIAADDVEAVKPYTGTMHDINNAFCSACSNGKLNVATYLLSIGAEVNVWNSSPICWAARHGRTEVVRFLINHGANVDANRGWPFYWAARNGHIEVVRLLVGLVTDIHARDGAALRWAAANGYLEIFKLVHPGAPPGFKNMALCSASRRGHIEIVRLLLSVGANPNVFDHEPLRLAADNERTDVFKLLIRKCNFPEVSTSELVQCAVQDEKMPVLEFLMKSVLGKRQICQPELARKYKKFESSDDQDSYKKPVNPVNL